jgi:hypothetical protein
MITFHFKQPGWAVAVLAGAFFVIHCTLASVREYRAGRVLGGKFGDFDRKASPAGFWAIMAGNLGAVLMGVGFIVVGILGMLGYIRS